jgi:hypothetical protein
MIDGAFDAQKEILRPAGKAEEGPSERRQKAAVSQVRSAAAGVF